MENYVYIIKAAFSSDFSAARLNSIPFIISFLLFASALVLFFLAINATKEPPVHHAGSQAIVVVIPLFLAIIFGFFAIVTRPNMEGIKLKPEFLGDISKVEFNKHYESYNFEEPLHLLGSSEEASRIRVGIVQQIPDGKILPKDSFIKALKEPFFECATYNASTYTVSPMSIDNINKEIKQQEKSCTLEAGKKISEDNIVSNIVIDTSPTRLENLLSYFGISI